jgi:hypothetical protein
MWGSLVRLRGTLPALDPLIRYKAALKFRPGDDKRLTIAILRLLILGSCKHSCTNQEAVGADHEYLI